MIESSTVLAGSKRAQMASSCDCEKRSNGGVVMSRDVSVSSSALTRGVLWQVMFRMSIGAMPDGACGLFSVP